MAQPLHMTVCFAGAILQTMMVRVQNLATARSLGAVTLLDQPLEGGVVTVDMIQT